VRTLLVLGITAFVAGGGALPGGRIAFSAGPLEPGKSNVYVYDLATRKATRLTHDRGVHFDPSISPAGRRVVFRSMRNGNEEIRLANASGGPLRNLTRNAAVDYAPTWSPDGRRIAFASTRGGLGELPYIWVMNADGSHARRLTNRFTGEYPAFSPDGKRIVFATNQPVRQDGFDIVVANADGTNAHRVTHNDVYEMGPAWSPDGKWIAYYAGNGGDHDLYLMRPDGSGTRRVTHAGGELPTWSPDGRWLLYMAPVGLTLIHPDGTGARRLNVGLQEAMFPSWSRVG
jgi:TolB protein